MSLVSVENIEDFTPPITSTPKRISGTEAASELDDEVKTASVLENELTSDTVGVCVAASPSLDTASAPETVVSFETVSDCDAVGVCVTASPNLDTASAPETVVSSETVGDSDAVGVCVTASPSLDTASAPVTVVSSETVGVELPTTSAANVMLFSESDMLSLCVSVSDYVNEYSTGSASTSTAADAHVAPGTEGSSYAVEIGSLSLTQSKLALSGNVLSEASCSDMHSKPKLPLNNNTADYQPRMLIPFGLRAVEH